VKLNTYIHLLSKLLNTLNLYPVRLNGHDACFNTEINLHSKTLSDNETRHSLMMEDSD